MFTVPALSKHLDGLHKAIHLLMISGIEHRSLKTSASEWSVTTTLLSGYHARRSKKHGAIVRRAVQAVDKDMQVIITGSYRRGALDSGDIDLLITKPDASLDEIQSLIVNIVVPKLFDDGFLQVGLATSRHNHDASKWHGASALPGNVWRRIDLLFVPGAELGAAILYFTGNDIFNRSMRLLARKKGMALNQRGLYTDVLRSAGVKINPGRLLEAHDERRIFAALGVPWRPPEHRTC